MERNPSITVPSPALGKAALPRAVTTGYGVKCMESVGKIEAGALAPLTPAGSAWGLVVLQKRSI